MKSAVLAVIAACSFTTVDAFTTGKVNVGFVRPESKVWVEARNDELPLAEGSMNAFLKATTASALVVSSLIGPVDVAYAAVKTAPADTVVETTVTTPAKKKGAATTPTTTGKSAVNLETEAKMKAVAAEPQAAEKSLVATTKAQVAASNVAVSSAQKVVSEASAAYKNAVKAEKSASSKLLESKKGVIKANDDLSAAKKKASKNALDQKNIEILSARLGKCHG